MRRCLVTGGCGFIGSHLVDALLQRGDAVRVLDNLSSGRDDYWDSSQGRLELVVGDLRDPDTVRHAVQDVEVVYHQAALPSVPRSVEDPLSTHEVCATGTLHLLQAARQAGVRRVVYAASSSAYGLSPQPLKRETDPTYPVSPYAVAKLAGEMYCQAFTEVYGLETVCLRYFNIFGPRQDPNSPYSAVIPLFVTAMLRGKPPTIHGDGLQSRDFTYVSNVIEANLLAAQAPDCSGKVYNIGAGGSVNLLRLVETLNRLLGTNIPPVHDAPRPGDVRHSQADISLAARELGYRPKVDFEDGLRRSIAYYRQLAEHPSACQAEP